MKAKLLVLSAIVALSLTTPAFARTHLVQTRTGQRVVTNFGNHRDHWHSRSGVSWNIGIGLPFYGRYYGAYPYYGSYYGGYPYYGDSYYRGYTNDGSYRSYPYGYSGNYYPSNYPYYSSRTVYPSSNGSVVARVQERLARAGYHAGRIDGVMGPCTRYAIRAYERRHGLPAYGVIDRRLLTTMGIA